jgi:hypothetical protein
MLCRIVTVLSQATALILSRRENASKDTQMRALENHKF